jgi:hypothetical protein
MLSISLGKMTSGKKGHEPTGDSMTFPKDSGQSSATKRGDPGIRVQPRTLVCRRVDRLNRLNQTDDVRCVVPASDLQALCRMLSLKRLYTQTQGPPCRRVAQPTLSVSRQGRQSN